MNLPFSGGEDTGSVVAVFTWPLNKGHPSYRNVAVSRFPYQAPQKKAVRITVVEL